MATKVMGTAGWPTPCDNSSLRAGANLFITSGLVARDNAVRAMMAAGALAKSVAIADQRKPVTKINVSVP
ncbi:MAG: hypothetical protein WBV78_11815 [Roseobacter sp.]